jgi:hypothetical protein
VILSEYRPGLVRSDLSFLHASRSSSALPLPLYHNEKKESMRRDVRILLVGDGTSFSIVVLVANLNTMHCTSQRVLVKVPLSLRSSRRHTYPMSVPVSCSENTPNFVSDSQVQHVVPEVTISPEFTSENVSTYIVDSGGKFPE